MERKLKLATIEKLNENIRKDNAAFLKLSKAEQRVQVARDAIAMLKAEILKAQTGVYVGPPLFTDRSHPEYEVDKTDTQISKALEKLEQCNVCALGSILVASIRRFNDVTFGEHSLGNRSYLTDYLETKTGLFTYQKLTEIESWFEHEFYYTTTGIDNKQDRLLILLENIVLGKGTFTPELLEAQIMEYRQKKARARRMALDSRGVRA